MQSELLLQLRQAAAASQALGVEVGVLDAELTETTREAEGLLRTLHASALQRASQQQQQLRLWEEKASVLLSAGIEAKLDLILLEGNANIFEQFRSLMRAQTGHCGGGAVRAARLEPTAPAGGGPLSCSSHQSPLKPQPQPTLRALFSETLRAL